MQFYKKYPFAPAILFFIITVILLTLPGTSFPKSHLFDIPYFDKWVHIGMFSILCILFSLPFKNRSISRSQKVQWIWLITILGIGFGISMEFVQKYWVANRSFELGDIAADSIGCILALLFSYNKLI